MLRDTFLKKAFLILIYLPSAVLSETKDVFRMVREGWDFMERPYILIDFLKKIPKMQLFGGMNYNLGPRKHCIKSN